MDLVSICRMPGNAIPTEMIMMDYKYIYQNICAVFEKFMGDYTDNCGDKGKYLQHCSNCQPCVCEMSSSGLEMVTFPVCLAKSILKYMDPKPRLSTLNRWLSMKFSVMSTSPNIV